MTLVGARNGPERALLALVVSPLGAILVRVAGATLRSSSDGVRARARVFARTDGVTPEPRPLEPVD